MAHKRGVERSPREVFLSELSRHGSVRKACQVSGLSRGQVRGLLRDDEDFAQEYADAMEDSVDRIEEAGTNLARNGDDKLIKLFLEVKRYKKSTEVSMVDIKPTINITIGNKK